MDPSSSPVGASTAEPLPILY